MKFRSFLLSLSISFGLALLAIVVLPYFKMRSMEPIPMDMTDAESEIFIPKRAGRIADGAAVYAENGCYLCHTQLIRPTYAGNDLFRPDWAGLAADEDRGDTRRETNAFDFQGEKYAQIGISRMGPDLSNLGRRVDAVYAPEEGISSEAWLYRHLYNPRWKPLRRLSTCPSFRFMFSEANRSGISSFNLIPEEMSHGKDLTPNSDAKALVSYLLSLKKDQAVPDSLNFAPTGAEPGADLVPALEPSTPEPAANPDEDDQNLDTTSQDTSSEANPVTEVAP